IFQWAGWGFVVLPAAGEPSYVGDPLWGISRAEAAGWIRDLRLTHAPGEEIAGLLADSRLANARVGLVGAADGGSWRRVEAPGAGRGAARRGRARRAAPAASVGDAEPLSASSGQNRSAEEMGSRRETSAIPRRVCGARAGETRPGVWGGVVLAGAHRLCRQY